MRAVISPVGRLRLGISGLAAWLVMCGTGTADAAGAPAAETAPISVQRAGAPLRELLPEVSRQVSAEHTCARSLETQRVTLFVKDLHGSDFRSALGDLLSAPPEGKVSWNSSKEGTWKLEESLNRRRMALALTESDLPLYRSYLAEQVSWLEQTGERELAAARMTGERSRILPALIRVANAMLVRELGEAGIAQLFAMRPVVLRIGDTREPLRSHLREYVSSLNSGVGKLPAAQVDAHSMVYVLARNPADHQGARIVESWVDPSGRCFRRSGSNLSIPHVFNRPTPAGLYVPTPDPADGSARVTVNLAPTADPKETGRVSWNLDEVLGAIAASAGRNLIADGYLRPGLVMPGNLTLRDYPLHQLLDAVALAWNCTWKYAAGSSRVILFRANDWWLEDVSDVDPKTVTRLAVLLPAGQPPTLQALREFAELTRPQAHKLVETGYCPGAFGVVKPLWYDDAGGKACLQFFNRLPEPLQLRAASPAGLRLGDAPAHLVDEWLATTLIAAAGAIERGTWSELVFSLVPTEAQANSTGGYLLSIKGDRVPGPRWQQRIAPPNRLPLR